MISNILLSSYLFEMYVLTFPYRNYSSALSGPRPQHNQPSSYSEHLTSGSKMGELNDFFLEDDCNDSNPLQDMLGPMDTMMDTVVCVCVWLIMQKLNK